MTKLSVNQTMLRAASLEKKGEIAQARALYQSVIHAYPNNQRARMALAKLEVPLAKASARNIHPPKEQAEILNALYNQGRFGDVVARSKQLARQFPSSFLVWSFLGAGSARSGQNAQAAEAYRQAAKLNPNDPAIFYSLGVALQQLGQSEAAISAYQRALGLRPDYADAHNNLGNVYKELGKPDAAIAAYRRTLEYKPNHVGTLGNIGNTLKEQGKLDDAISVYQRALAIKPDDADVSFNMGNALHAQGKLDEAIRAYRHALAINPAHAEAHYNLGKVLQAQYKLDDAVQAYQRALAIKPDYAAAYDNIGNALKDQHNLDEAILAYRHALAIKPDNAETLSNLGSALNEQRKLDEAVLAYRRALEIDPSLAGTQAQLIHQLQHLCDWTQIEQHKDAFARLGVTTPAVSPFCMLSAEDNAARQLERSRRWVSENYGNLPHPLPENSNRRPRKLRIGYFSADFHNHPALYLTSGLFREHDKAGFEVFVFSYGHHKEGELRQQVKQDVDHFFDVSGFTDTKIFDLAREKQLDIAINMAGYTADNRCGFFQLRLAPVQINYLGYPGSMGADFMDYIIADPVLIPQSARAHYSENVIYLPHSYLPNDDTRKIAETRSSRADFGLPEDGFVFCCFNNNYKIGPREFDIWMRLLSQVQGSVLWLLRSNGWSEQNLRNEAERRGVDPARLIFAEKVPHHSEHLARHKHADLFLDTFNYNAHTTASEALWSGLPVITKQGGQFSARVAASVLTAVGLPELITTSEEEYESRILDLARRPDELAAIRAKLAGQRLSQPLFDTKRYTRNFERAFRLAFDLYSQGKDPQDIRVTEQAEESPTLT